MIGFLMLLSQATNVVATPAPPPPPQPTLESETVPAFDLACRLVDERLVPHLLELRQSGGRGYLDPESPIPRRSRISVTVLRDDTGLFQGDDRLIGDSDGYRPTRVEASHAEHGAIKLETFHAGGDRLAALVYTQALARISYTGFCEMVRHHQDPLSEAETREYLSR